MKSQRGRLFVRYGIIGLLLLSFSSATWSANDANRCEGAYSKAKILSAASATGIPEIYDLSRRGEFEKTEDYKRRVAKEFKREQEDADKQASAFMEKHGPIKFRYDLSNSAKYNADKEILFIEHNPIFVQEVGTKNAKRRLATFIAFFGEEKVGPYVLGVKKSNRNSFGVAYSTKLKDGYLSANTRSLSDKPSSKGTGCKKQFL